MVGLPSIGAANCNRDVCSFFKKNYPSIAYAVAQVAWFIALFAVFSIGAASGSDRSSSSYGI
jgi:hypothetical protein